MIEAIARVMADMKGVGKDQHNKEQGYSFRGIEDVTATLQPVLGRHCVVIIPHETSHRRESFTVKSGAVWTDDFITISYSIYGPGGTGDMVEAGPFLGVGRDNADKGANKARSMAYKYMLTEVFCIGDKKDDADETTPPAEDPFLHPDMVAAFIGKAQRQALDLEAVVAEATEGRTKELMQVRMSEYERLRDAARRALAAKEASASPASQGEGEPAPASMPTPDGEASTEGTSMAPEGAPPAPAEPEPQPAGGRGRARLGSKKDEDG